MKYVKVIVNHAGSEHSEILIAILSELGFEAFEEGENILLAYIPEGAFDPTRVSEVLNDFQGIAFEWEIMPDVNWNEQWEKQYEPVTIDGRCLIRAPFHEPQEGYPLEIVIEPKMSFGTAHHETTALMIGFLLDQELPGKNVLDMGCGTGILAILASKLGANQVLAIDNDEWAWRNSRENMEINKVSNIEVELGDASVIGARSFDVVLANINRNVLLESMPELTKCLSYKGIMVISGFYAEDLNVLSKAAEGYGMALNGYKSLNNWTIAWFEKVKET